MTFRFDDIDADKPVWRNPGLVRPAYRTEKTGEYRPPAQMVANARWQPRTPSIRPGKKK